jgi:hypothetical protein
MCEGIVDELQGIELGDKRLNRRSALVMEALADNPEASVNAACDGWSDTLAAYRFFNNPAVTPEQIPRPHLEATQRRMRQHPVVLIVQDTTELDFTKHPTDDAQCLNTEQRFGLYEHVSLAVTPDKLCLGVVGSEFLDRAPESLGKADERRTLPIEEKESFRWLTGYRLACQLAAECPQTQIVSIADREADIYDIFVEAQQQTGPRADYIIRAKEDRSTRKRDLEAGPAVYRKVRDEVSGSKRLATRTIELRATPQRAARQAHLEIRALTVEVKPPHARSHLPSVTHNVVLVEEVGGPGDGTHVSWLRLTTLPIETLDDILRIIDAYVARWTVEVYFRTLKTGCRVEQIQLETNHRLKNCLAFYKIIAWRILPPTPLYRRVRRERMEVRLARREAETPPQETARAVGVPAPADPTGRLQQSSDRNPPRPPTPLDGLGRMTDFATTWLAFGPQD